MAKRRRKKSSKRKRSKSRKGRRSRRKRGRGSHTRASRKRTDISYGAEFGPHSEAKGYEPWIQEEGSLGEGFLTDMTFAQRKKAVERALKNEISQHGGDYQAAYRSTLGKIMVLNRSRDLRKKYGSELDQIRNWFVETHGASTPRYERAANPAVKRLANSLCR